MSRSEYRTSGHEFREVEHCWIPMRDGVRLSARLWIAESTDENPVPGILEYIPYRKRDMVRARDQANHPTFARHGYGCVRVDMRGSGDSEGFMADMYSSDELEDAIEVIDWIAAQPWCDGSIGMMGTSWGGTSSLQAALRKPEALKAVIAVCATNNRFEDDIHHMGGCVLTDTVEWGATLPTILASPPDPDTVGPGWRQMWLNRLERLTFPLENWLAHETHDDYWKFGSVSEDANLATCPILAIGGWADRYSNTVMNLLEQAPDCGWGIVGPWGHHYPDAGCPGPGIGFQAEALRWWDRWLKLVPNGVEKSPRLRAWVSEYQTPADRHQFRSGRWISERVWPSANVKLRRYFLTASNMLEKNKSSTGTMPVPLALEAGIDAGDTGYFGRSGGLPLDQRAGDACSLVFESAPLKHTLDILGRVQLQLCIESDQAMNQVVARLNDVSPEHGVVRVSYAVNNLAQPGQETKTPSVPGRKTILTIDFANTAYRFLPGHHIRLALAGSYWPVIVPAAGKTRLRVRCGESYLELPVRPVPADERPVIFPDPEKQDTPDVKQTTNPSLQRWTRLDARNGKYSVGWHQPYKSVRFENIELTFGFETQAEHNIDNDEAISARSSFEHRLRFERKDATIEVTGSASLLATEASFIVKGTIAVEENGRQIFSRTWKPLIPRKHS